MRSGRKLTTNKSYLVDSGIVIRHLRGDARASGLMVELRRSGKLSASTLVVFEVLRGTRNSREERTGRDFFTLVTVLDVDIDSAQKAAHIARSNRGVMFGDRAALDAVIAGTALANGLTLVTLNTRQFARLNVPGLRLLLIDQQARDWAAQVA